LSFPADSNLPYVLQYIPLAKQGEVFATRSSCADAVVNVIVKGDTSEQVVANIQNIYEWFNEHSKWELFE